MPIVCLYGGKAKYGRIVVSRAKKLRSLEGENAKLKKRLADAMQDNTAPHDLL
jgi:putative transposase